MKTGHSHWFKLTLLAAMLLMAHRSQAYYTNYLDAVSNALTSAQTTVSNRQQLARIERALATLAKPSTNVAGDYKLFVTAATQLGPLADEPPFPEIGTNVFGAFTNEAQAQIFMTGDRIAALSEFVRQRRAASNALNQAQRALNRIPTSDTRQALLLGRQVFTKINTANRIAAQGEANPGFTPEEVVGKRLLYRPRGGIPGSVYFNNDTEASHAANLDSTYEYDRDGFHTATVDLTTATVTGPLEIEFMLKFTSATNGTFTFRAEDEGGAGSGLGTFTIE